MLIRDAEIWRQGRADLRIAEGRIGAIGALSQLPGEPVIEAAGGALLPGLHDHHVHLPALAARRASLFCGPPEVETAAALAQALAQPGAGWLRGVGYHESVAGMLDARALDCMQPERPVRVQHRSGRMWFLNSRALDLLLDSAPPPPGLELSTGRLFEEDAWLRAALRSAPPDFGATSAELARCGITGVTDMSPNNDPAMAEHFRRQQELGALKQNCLLAGSIELAEARFSERLELGPAKLHLHETQLPDFDDAVAFAVRAHEQGRSVAVHCVTELELVFALSLLETAGPMAGDRIEHASIAPDHLVSRIAEQRLWVATQPHFIAERGEQYLRELEANDHAHLYRLKAFLDAGVPLAGGSDAPFGAGDPWAAMRAATARGTPGGETIGAEEKLTPEEALSLFLADPEDFAKQRAIDIGSPADLVLLGAPWADARERLVADDVAMTFIDGSIVYNRVDEPPGERGLRANARAGEHHQRCALAPDPA